MSDAEHEDDEQEELVLCTRDKNKSHDLVVIVLRSYYPELNDELEEEEAAQTAPEQSVHLLAKRGKKFVVLGAVGWWLYVRRFGGEETGYIPSTHVAPITDGLSCEE